MSLAEDDQDDQDLRDAQVPYPNPFAGPDPNAVSIPEFNQMMQAGVDPVEHEKDMRMYFEQSVEPEVLNEFFRRYPYGFMPMPTSQLVSAPATYAARQPGPSSTTASNPAGGDDGNDDAMNLWDSDEESQPGPADFARAGPRQYPTPFDGTVECPTVPQPEALLGMRPAGNLNV